MNSKRTRKRYNKNSKILIIMVLIIGVIGLSIGFSAFSKNLDINSTATVTPDPSDFKVLFSSSGTDIETNPISVIFKKGDATGTTAKIDNSDPSHPKITDMKATFTNLNQAIQWNFYVTNQGKYTAYLKKIEFGDKTCTAKPGTSQELVDDACRKIHLLLSFNISDSSNPNYLRDVSKTCTITNHPLSKGAFEKVTIWISTNDVTALADGDFDVEFGDITLTYSTTDS